MQTGVPEAQAEVIINAVAGATTLPDVSKLATKDDLEKFSLELRGEIKELRAEFKGELKGMKGELIW